MIFSTEKQLKEYGDKLSEGNKTAIETALNKLKEAHKSQDVDLIEAALKELETVWQAASQELYQAQQQAQGQQQADSQQQPADEPNKDSGVTDVDYEEVK
jgi:molecular chaperone DnaK